MLFKILLWAIIGYIVYSWFQDKFKLKEGEKKTTIHHHHYKEGKKEGKGKDDDYIDFEELK
jgi:hypothetical protein